MTVMRENDNEVDYYSEIDLNGKVVIWSEKDGWSEADFSMAELMIWCNSLPFPIGDKK